MRKIVLVSNLIIIIILTAFLGTACNKTELPLELKNLYEKTANQSYWSIDKTNTDIVMCVNNSIFSLMIEIKYVIDEFNNFEEFSYYAYDITISDSRIEDYVIGWRKTVDLESDFGGPYKYEVVPYTAYDVKSYFDSTKGKISISEEKISDFEELETSKSNWVGYKAKYNLKGAKGGLPMSEDQYKGDLVLFIDKDEEILREAYIHGDKLVYIRHIETGKLEINIDELEPEDTLKLVWKYWQSDLLPFLEQLKQNNVIK